MNYLNLIAAILFIILGLLAGKFPNFIAGYNNLSVPEKRKINEKSLVRFVQMMLFSLGIMNIGFYIILSFTGWPESYGGTFLKYSIIAVVIFAVLYLNVRKPHHKK